MTRLHALLKHAMIAALLCGSILLSGCATMQNAGHDWQPAPIRVVQIDLDYVYDPDPAQMAHNIDRLVARIAAMKINTVFLQAFADPKGTGLASELYFPNRQLPTRADLFCRVAGQLKTSAKVAVYGWLPVLSFDFGDKVVPVMAWDMASGAAAPDPKAYKRASPFDPTARQRITDIYEDMASDCAIDGILFHDDAMLSDFEDASPPALQAYANAGFPSSINAIRADPEQMAKWTNFKIDTLISFTQDLATHARRYRPLLTARNIYALPVLNGNSREWFAQDYDRFLMSYDYTAIEAMPQMENIPDSDADAWMQKLVDAAAARPNGLNRTIFELQAVDWRKTGDSRALPTEHLAKQMRFLAAHGAMNFGYYPDDFVANTPDAPILQKDFTLEPASR